MWLESRDFEVLPTHFGDGGLELYKKHGPWELVLTDYRFFPGTKIRDGEQLAAAIHGINPLQTMSIMAADPKAARERLPEALHSPGAAEASQSGASVAAATAACVATLIRMGAFVGLADSPLMRRDAIQVPAGSP